MAQWQLNGLPICTAPSAQEAPLIEPDPTGGALIARPDNRSGTNTELYIQRVGGNGVVRWATDGVPIASGPIAARNMRSLVSNGNYGTVVCWDQQDGFAPYATHIMSNHVRPDGIVGSFTSAQLWQLFE